MKRKLIPMLIVMIMVWSHCAVFAASTGRTEGEKYRKQWSQSEKSENMTFGASMKEGARDMYDFLMAPFRWMGDQLKGNQE